MVYENCSDVTVIFATIGVIVAYFAIGALIGSIVNALMRNKSGDDKDLLVILSVVFWPVAIVMGIVYAIARLLALPFIVATKEDLSDTEDRLNRRIDDECSTCVDVANDLDIFTSKVPFKVDDIITGIVPQTDADGSNMSYNILYRGCRCRVLSINERGSMKVILVSHKDKEAHADRIGETFTVPARNFTLVKKVAKKRKVVKGKKAKRAKR